MEVDKKKLLNWIDGWRFRTDNIGTRATLFVVRKRIKDGDFNFIKKKNSLYPKNELKCFTCGKFLGSKRKVKEGVIQEANKKGSIISFCSKVCYPKYRLKGM